MMFRSLGTCADRPESSVCRRLLGYRVDPQRHIARKNLTFRVPGSRRLMGPFRTESIVFRSRSWMLPPFPEMGPFLSVMSDRPSGEQLFPRVMRNRPVDRLSACCAGQLFLYDQI